MEQFIQVLEEELPWQERALEMKCTSTKPNLYVRTWRIK